MSSTSRYLFETDFDDPDVTDMRAPVYSEQDMARAVEEARQAERADLGSLEEKRAADLLSTVATRVDALVAQRQADLSALSDQAADIAIAICRKILPTMAAQNALTEIEGHIRRVLAEIQDEPRVVVRLAEANIPALQNRIDALAGGFDGKIVLVTDDRLAATDCHVMWADGGSERDVQRTWSLVDDAVKRLINHSAPADPGHPHTTTPADPGGVDAPDMPPDADVEQQPPATD